MNNRHRLMIGCVAAAGLLLGIAAFAHARAEASGYGALRDAAVYTLAARGVTVAADFTVTKNGQKMQGSAVWKPGARVEAQNAYSGEPDALVFVDSSASSSLLVVCGAAAAALAGGMRTGQDGLVTLDLRGEEIPRGAAAAIAQAAAGMRQGLLENVREPDKTLLAALEAISGIGGMDMQSLHMEADITGGALRSIAFAASAALEAHTLEVRMDARVQAG